MSEPVTTTTLDKVVQFSGGGTPSKKNAAFWNGDIPWVSPKDMKSKYISTSIDKVTSEGVKNSSAKLIPADSLLIVVRSGILSRTIPIGTTTTDLTTNQDLKALIPNRDVLATDYLHYFLASAEHQILKLVTRGATVHRLSTDHLKALTLPIPPLPEQQRIVSILDEAFAAIDRAKEIAQQNLANARELFESYLNRVFTEKGEGWEEKTLADLGLAERVITYGVIKLGDAIADGVPCLRTSNVKKLQIDLTGMKRIARSLSEEYGRTILKGGEVLVNVRGTLGGVAVVPPEMVGWNVSREVAVVPIDTECVEPSFVALWIAAKNQQDWLTGVKKGAAYTGINIEDLRRLAVSYPNKAEQVRLVTLLESAKTNCRTLECEYRQKSNALDELKQSILQKAFTGQLTAKSPELEAVG